MTVIATDGYSIASDTRCTDGSLIIQRPWHKLIVLPDGSAFGTAGDSEAGLLFQAWLENGEQPELRPSLAGQDFIALRLHPNGALTLYTTLCLPEAVPAPYAIGSGAHLAIGALEAGASPLRAVEIACTYDPSCGAPVDTFTVRHRRGRTKSKRRS